MPAEDLADFEVIAVVVSYVNSLLLCREGNKSVRPRPIDCDKLLGQGLERNDLITAKIVDITHRSVIGGRQEQRLYHVIDVVEVALLGAVAVDQNILRFNDTT